MTTPHNLLPGERKYFIVRNLKILNWNVPDLLVLFLISFLVVTLKNDRFFFGGWGGGSPSRAQDYFHERKNTSMSVQQWFPVQDCSWGQSCARGVWFMVIGDFWCNFNAILVLVKDGPSAIKHNNTFKNGLNTGIKDALLSQWNWFQRYVQSVVVWNVPAVWIWGIWLQVFLSQLYSDIWMFWCHKPRFRWADRVDWSKMWPS